MDKNRVITIKGIGSLDIPVDLIKIDFTLEETNKDYKKGHENFDNSIIELQNIVKELGFNETDLKTSDIKVSTEYDNKKKGGRYVDVFVGYKFLTGMTLSFDLDSQKLGEVFTALSNSKAAPKIEVRFTVKDEESVKTKLLGNAAKDAKNKATVLCEAVGTKLGKLINVNYNWRDLDLYSSTRYRRDDFDDDDDTDFLGRHICYDRIEPLKLHKWNFTPKDISVEDEAYFIWEITD